MSLESEGINAHASSRIRTVITKSGLSVEDLHAQTGIPKARLRRYLSDEQSLLLGDVEAICQALGVDPRALLLTDAEL